MKPGETVCADNALEINVGRDTLMLEVAPRGSADSSSVKTMAAGKHGKEGVDKAVL